MAADRPLRGNGDQSYAILVEDDSVLVGTWEGVRRFDGKRWFDEDYLMPGGKRLPTHALAKAGKEYWVGLLHDGVNRVDSDNPTKNFLYTRENTAQLASNEIRDIEVAPVRAMKIKFIEGTPYIATEKGVLYKEGNRWLTYSQNYPII